MAKSKKNSAYLMAVRSIFIAIILMQCFIPFLGYLPLGFVNVTVIHITVIVAAIVLGPKDGALMGLVWGCASVVRAFTAPTSPLDTLIFTNPIISVIPRILVGYFAGITYQFLKPRIQRWWSMAIASAVGSLTNTLLVIILMRAIYTPTLMKFNHVHSGATLDKILAGLIGANGIPELIAAVIIAPAISMAILKANKNLDK